MPRHRSVVTCGCLALLTVIGLANAGTQDATKTIMEGVYTLDQARRGERIYRRQCTVCHRDNLLGNTVDGGPPLRGLPFTTRWQSLSLDTLLATIEELMPLEAPGSLSRQEYVDVLTFVLWANDIPAGDTELSTSAAALKHIMMRFEP